MALTTLVETPTFLINLDGSTDRLQFATSQLDAAGITFERVPAFDGRGLSPADLPDYDPAAAMALLGRELRGGEVGCYLSHLDAAKRFLATGKSYGLVFEDDLQLKPAAVPGIQKVVAWLAGSSYNFDLAHISATRRRIVTPIEAFVTAAGTYQIELAHYYPMRTTALIWTRSGAEAFIAQHLQIRMPIDLFLRYWQVRRGRALSVWPGLVKASRHGSDIRQHSTSSPSPGRHWLYWPRKQRLNISNQIHALGQKLALRDQANRLREQAILSDKVGATNGED